MRKKHSLGMNVDQKIALLNIYKIPPLASAADRFKAEVLLLLISCLSFFLCLVFVFALECSTKSFLVLQERFDCILAFVSPISLWSMIVTFPGHTRMLCT